MGANTQFVTQDVIRNASLPNHGGRYGVIPHGFIIDETRNELANQGIGIIRELYKTNKDGQIAQGIYHLAAAHDSDMGMMFAWSNSYNKMMRFKCAIGASVFICMNGVVSGDLANYSRKHIGQTALQDAVLSIKTQIGGAFKHYSQLIADKELLKNVILTRKDQASIIGRLFVDEEILTPTQTSIVKKELFTPTHVYNSDPNSAWTLYNHVTLALKESHPLTYLSDHQKVHSFFVNEYGQLLQYPLTTQEAVDEEDETDVREDLIVSPAGSDFDLDKVAFGVNFL